MRTVLSDKDKVLLEENDEDIVIHGVLKNKVIKRKNIRTMYYENDNLNILYDNNKILFKRMVNMRLSEKGNLFKIIDNNINEKVLFHYEDVFTYFFITLMLVNFLSVIKNVNLVIFIAATVLYLACSIAYVNNYIHCFNVYDCENKELILYDMLGNIKKKTKINLYDMKYKVKRYNMSKYLELSDKHNKIEVKLCSEIEYPVYAKQEVLEVMKQYKGKREDGRGKR